MAPGRDSPAGQLLPVGVALAVMLLTRVAVNVNRLSMHDFYRWRLADAFAVTRRAARGAESGAGARAVRRGRGHPRCPTCATSTGRPSRAW